MKSDKERFKDFEDIQRLMLATLLKYDGKCLDVDGERQDVATALANAVVDRILEKKGQP